MLQEKYKAVIDAAINAAVAQLQVEEKEGVLYINGTAPTGSVKDLLWTIYGQIDPNFLTGDLVMDVQVSIDATITKVKVTTESSNLNIRKGPGTDQPIVGKAAHGEIITLINKSNDQWWLVKTADGEEGYSYAQYLTPVE
ncbi:MAG: SH3 domain-containing protein [Ferruginibacter sp.]